MNNWIGTGRLTSDPELSYTTSGTAVCKFTLAVDRSRKDAQGNKQTDFINIVVWQKLGELCAQYLTKGRKALVSGELQQRQYENREGQKVRVTEIHASTVEFLDRAEGGRASGNQSQQRTQQRIMDDPFSDDQPIEISEDDLPF